MPLIAGNYPVGVVAPPIQGTEIVAFHLYRNRIHPILVDDKLDPSSRRINNRSGSGEAIGQTPNQEYRYSSASFNQMIRYCTEIMVVTPADRHVRNELLERLVATIAAHPQCQGVPYTIYCSTSFDDRINNLIVEEVTDDGATHDFADALEYNEMVPENITIRLMDDMKVFSREMRAAMKAGKTRAMLP